MKTIQKINSIIISAILFTACGSGNNENSNDPSDISAEYYEKEADCNCKEIDVMRRPNGEPMRGKENIYYKVGTRDLFSGTCEEKFGNGKRKLFIQYQDGYKNGEAVYWYEDGQLQGFKNYSMGKNNGEFKRWEEGNKDKLIYLGYFDNGLFVDKGFEYEDGKLKKAWFIANGEKEESEDYSSLVFSKRPGSGNEYEIKLFDKLPDDVLLKYAEEIANTHFKDVSEIIIGKEILYDNVPRIIIHYMDFENSHEEKNAESIRIGSLIAGKFPKYKIPGASRTNTTTNENNIEVEEDETSKDNNIDPVSTLKGTWEGQMSGKNLKLVIESVNGKNITGYNTLGTATRKLTGSYAEYQPDCMDCVGYILTLNEPGDDKWDGVFTIYLIVGGNMNGEWKANNGKKTSEFMLEKK